MERKRIAGLLQPFLEGESLSDSQLGQISAYLDLLLRWNARVNLTAVREGEEIITRHFGESLVAARHLLSHDDRLPNPARVSQGGNSRHVIDVGSGAGFPGLPIKIWAPSIHLTLIESNHKKVAFLREVIRTLALGDAEVFAGRAEDFPGQGQIITVRAVERFDQILPIASRLTAASGRLALLIGEGQLAAANRATDMQWSEPLPIPLSDKRILRIGTKIGNLAEESKS